MARPTPPSSALNAARTFRALHDGFFVMPNPWDVASAAFLADFGIKAIATSSAALAWTLGARDGGVTRTEAIAHAVALGGATGLPVNGDFEAGYGDTPAEVGETIRAAIDAGVAGCSVEDLQRGRAEPLIDIDEACRRIEAAREAVERVSSPFVLTARCEAFLTREPDPLGTVRARLPRYRAAGANVLYAPAVRTREEIEAVLEAADGMPVNVLGGVGGLSDDVSALEAMGVTRISLGSGLYRAAFGALAAFGEGLAAGTLASSRAVTSAAIERILPPTREAPS